MKRWIATSLLVTSACVLADVSLDRRGCPCVAGWVCRDDACVPANSSTAASDGGDDAPLSDAGCTHVEFDPNNCGACGHSCRGAVCQDGLCVPTRLLEHVESPAELAISPNEILFTTEGTYEFGGTVSYLRRSTKGLPVMASHQVLQSMPLSLAATNIEVFWVNGSGELHRAEQELPFDSGIPRATVGVSAAGVSDIVVDDPRVFIAERADAGAIRACDGRNLATCADGGGGSLVAVAQQNPRGLVVERASQRLFWIVDAFGGAILSCSIAGACAQPAVVAAGQPNAHALAVDASRVYWTNATANGDVASAPLDGLAPNESPTVLAHDLSWPWAIAVDGESVYVTTLGPSAVVDGGAPDGTIVRIPRTGGDPVVVAKALSRPWSVVVDGAWIYWANRGAGYAEGSIETVAK